MISGVHEETQVSAMVVVVAQKSYKGDKNAEQKWNVGRKKEGKGKNKRMRVNLRTVR